MKAMQSCDGAVKTVCNHHQLSMFTGRIFGYHTIYSSVQRMPTVGPNSYKSVLPSAATCHQKRHDSPEKAWRCSPQSDKTSHWRRQVNGTRAMEGHECAFTFSYSVAKKRLRKAHPLQQLPYLKMVCKCLIMFVLCRILCSFVLRFQTFFFQFLFDIWFCN